MSSWSMRKLWTSLGGEENSRRRNAPASPALLKHWCLLDLVIILTILMTLVFKLFARPTGFVESYLGTMYASGEKSVSLVMFFGT